MNSWWLILATLLFSALFSGMEIAFVSANRLKVELDKKRGRISGKILAGFMHKPSRLITALLLGNNIALVVYGSVMANILEPPLAGSLPSYMNNGFWILLMQTLISTIIILILAEFIPKALFRMKPNRILSFFAPLAFIFYWSLIPLVLLFVGISELILKLFRVKLTREKYVFSAVDLDNYLKEFSPDEDSEEEMEPELQIFQNAMDFRTVKIRECMIPRTEIKALEITDSINVLKDLYINTGHSKILIYRESIDNIIGYTHSYDLFSSPKNIQSILKPIPIIPETLPAREALSMLTKEHKSAAVVVDEFGGTSGMVTMEDIMEEIFGEIEDEHDKDELSETQVSPNEFIFSGRTEIDYINEKYKLHLPESDDYETLAGLIISYHESIPAINEEIEVEGFLFRILQASDNRIVKVWLRVNLD